MGAAKHVVEVWLESMMLNANDLQKVQEKVDSLRVPSELGRILTKISKMFSGFTAKQWKNWVTVLLLFALFKYLPERDYRCLAYLVNACCLLCTTLINIKDVGTAHDHLLQFCKEFQTNYGKDCIKPNMHLHRHLADCMLDYGPVYSFWLYSFERYNGILWKYPTNNKSIELQMMRKFARDHDLDNLEFPAEYQVQMEPLISTVRDNIVQVVSTDCRKLLSLFTLANDQIDVTNELWYTVDYHSFAPPHVICCLDDDDVVYLRQVYNLFFPGVSDAVILRQVGCMI